MLKKILISTLLIFASIAVTALTLEGALRLVGFNPPKIVTENEYKDMNKLYLKNSKARWMGNLGNIIEFDNVVRTNSLKFHDRDYKEEKDPDVFRVLCLGDSYVEALQVPLEETFHKELEVILNQNPDISNKRVEVLAMGGSGNGSLRALITLKQQGLKFSPDLIIVFLTAQNDFNDDWHYFRILSKVDTYKHVNLLPPNETVKKLQTYEKLRVFKDSVLNQWIAVQVIKILDRKKSQEKDRVNWKERLGVFAKPESALFREGQKKWDEAFRILATNYVQMNQIAQENNAQFLVVFNDRKASFVSSDHAYLYKIMPEIEGQIDFDLPILKLQKVLDQHKIPYFDLNPVFKKHYESTKKTGHFVYDGHWNELGHELVAKHIEPFVSQYIH